MADLSKISERPAADREACTKRPEQMPAVVRSPADGPREITLRITNMVSAPGGGDGQEGGQPCECQDLGIYHGFLGPYISLG